MALGRLRRKLAALGWLGVVSLSPSASTAQAADPAAWFETGLQIDLSGTDQSARSAFDWYRKAAETGLPEAEFNVAVMLDSGRGVTPNLALAALWYARAASHGNQRAAYNLGQLYEAGQGVPQNSSLAQAWFAASDLPAARARLIAVPIRGAGNSPMSAPTPLSPVARSRVDGRMGVELVWTTKRYPEPVRFFVEVRTLDPDDPREVFAGFVKVSAVTVPSATSRGEYAWRVTSVARGAGHYVASDWMPFSVEPASVAVSSDLR